jgi:pyruvate dehydrogenase E2 component (dihydrolipoamide acetyltransferase)
LGLETAHLVGHSLGAAISIALADTRAKRLSSLTLIAPAGLGPDINGDALSGICRATRAESLGPWLRSLVANEDIVTDSYVRLAMAGREDTNLRAAQSRLANALFPDGVQAFDLRAALERIDTPTRIIWGKQDAIIPWKHALRAPGKMALHLFDGVGHMPQIECSAELGRILSSNV